MAPVNSEARRVNVDLMPIVRIQLIVQEWWVEAHMRGALILIISTVWVLGLVGCSGDPGQEQELPVQARPTTTSETTRTGPPPAVAEGLPPEWFVAESDGGGMTLKRFDDEDAWIWVSAKRMQSTDDLERYVDEHREAVESSPDGSYHDSGTVDTTKRGRSRWSWGSYLEKDEEGEQERHELVLFVPFERRDTVLVLRYMYPGDGPEQPARLQELVAVADGLERDS
jgi:hypothetical protein